MWAQLARRAAPPALRRRGFRTYQNLLLEQHSSVELLRQLLREAPPEALRKESAERDANGQTLLHAAVERATRSGGEGEKAEHAVALAELLAPEALLL